MTTCTPGSGSDDPRRTVGLALGAGSSKGWAHIGVIETLEAAGIPIDFVAGSSVGAFVGAVHASGRLDSLREFVLEMQGRRVFTYMDLVIPRSGILDGDKVHALFSIHTDAQRFEDLDRPVKIVATDLWSGDKLVIDSGDVIAGLRASMAIPGLFPPARYKGRWLVDGGLVDPVPIGVARAMGADVVVGVDLHGEGWARPGPPRSEEARSGPVHDAFESLSSRFRETIGSWFQGDQAPPLLEVLEASLGLVQDRIKRVNLAVEPPDVLVVPDLPPVKMLDYDRVDECIEAGAEAMEAHLPRLRALLGQTSDAQRPRT